MVITNQTDSESGHTYYISERAAITNWINCYKSSIYLVFWDISRIQRDFFSFESFRKLLNRLQKMLERTHHFRQI